MFPYVSLHKDSEITALIMSVAGAGSGKNQCIFPGFLRGVSSWICFSALCCFKTVFLYSDDSHR